MKFIATAPNGVEREGVHFTGFPGVAGVLVPLSIRLITGGTHELEFPMADIIYISGTTVRLDALVKQGYSVRVRLEAEQASADWARLSHPWIGTMSSAEVSLAH
jgi:hypothetical protein